MAPPKRLRAAATTEADKSYKILCISMYLRDIAEIDQKVADLKAGGLRWMSRSALIRAALGSFDHKSLLDAPKQ